MNGDTGRNTAVRVAGLLALAMTSALTVAAPPQPATLDCAPADLAVRALAAVNVQRALGARCVEREFVPAPPLAWAPAAARAAIAHADALASQGRLNHLGADRGQEVERLRLAGHVWASWAENLGRGTTDVAVLVAHWMANPGHCANLMNPRLTDLGLACRQLPGQASYWALALARPSPLRAVTGTR